MYCKGKQLTRFRGFDFECIEWDSEIIFRATKKVLFAIQPVSLLASSGIKEELTRNKTFKSMIRHMCNVSLKKLSLKLQDMQKAYSLLK